MRGSRRIPAAVPALAVVALAVAAVVGASPGGAQGERYLELVFDEVTMTSDVQYGTAVNQDAETVDLLLDVYEPAGDTVAARPLLIWIHGGGFVSGSKDGVLEGIIGEEFGRRGYVVASIGYRLSSTINQTAVDHAAEDAAAALEWLLANAGTYGIDDERVGIFGASAGAITALNVAYGPDLSAGETPAPVDAVLSYAGFTGIGLAEAGEVPVLMAHGTEDSLVRYEWAVTFCDDAVAAGVDCTLHSYDAGHVDLFVHVADITDHSVPFLYEHLGLAPPPTTTTTTSTTVPATSTTTTSTVSTPSAPSTTSTTVSVPPAPPAPVVAGQPLFTG